MRRPARDDFEKHLGGRTPPSDRPLRSVAELVTETRRVFSTPVPTSVRERHLDAVMRTFGGSLAPAPRRRRRGRFAAKVGALSLGLALAAGSAMAATGTLPEPAQREVAKAVQHVGINIPAHGLGHRPTTPAAENKARADRFTDAKKVWTRCIATEAPQHDGTEPFDPEEACGPKPTPEAAGPKSQETSPGTGPADKDTAPGNKKGHDVAPPSAETDETASSPHPGRGPGENNGQGGPNADHVEPSAG